RTLIVPRGQPVCYFTLLAVVLHRPRLERGAPHCFAKRWTPLLRWVARRSSAWVAVPPRWGPTTPHSCTRGVFVGGSFPGPGAAVRAAPRQSNVAHALARH